MKNQVKHLLIALALCSTLNFQLSTALAQDTAFTYQGRLNANGAAANGSYDLVFTLYTNSLGGTVIGGPVTNTATAVTNGLFTTLVDFGPGVFVGGSNWLALAVSTNGANAFTTLAPRQQITPTPYAITAGSVEGTVQSSQLTSIGNTNGGIGNFFVGPSGNAANSGYDNTANGYQALLNIANGSFNTANG
jgi:hypothetical protein